MQTVKTFSQVTKENLKHYVYCLVDSRDNSVFYVGRGQGNRVFDHVNDAIKTQTSSPKLDRIREIVKRGGHVLHYIIRHNLTVDEAKIVESTLIDVFTYSVFFQKWALTNLVAGYHQWYEGIKTVDEIELLYNCRKLQPKDHDKLLLVCLNTSYKKNVNLYDITRQAWPIADSKAECVDYVLGVYKGIVRCVIKPDKYTILPKQGKKNERNRVVFEGDYENNDRISDYLNTDATAYPFGLRQSVKYIGFGANTNKNQPRSPT